MKNKSIWIGALIGGLYALIPFLMTPFIPHDSALEIILRLVFILSGITFVLCMFIARSIWWLANMINIFLWILIGGLIGYGIKKRKKGR